MPYTFVKLLPERIPGASTHNARIFEKSTYGIEVTEPGLARQCVLGNLDPQLSIGAVAMRLAGQRRASANFEKPMPDQRTALSGINWRRLFLAARFASSCFLLGCGLG
jgi:hypothetical protein